MMLKLKYKDSWILYDNIETIIYKHCREADFCTKSGKFLENYKPPCNELTILETHDYGERMKFTKNGKAMLEIQMFRLGRKGFVIYTDSMAYLMSDNGGTLEKIYPYCPRTDDSKKEKGVEQ